MHMKPTNEKDILKSIQNATKLNLRGDERERTRGYLAEYMALKPLRGTENVREATSTRLNEKWWSTSYALTLVSYTKRPMPAFIVALILLVSGGTAIAAEGTLPGDMLYPVKVSINEEVRSAFSLTAQSQADWAINRTERRLKEASELALRGKLDAETQSTIDEHLTVHIDTVHKNTARLELEKEDDAAVDAEEKLHAVLDAHGRVLAQVRGVIDDDDIRGHVDEIVASLALKANVTERRESSLEAQLESRSPVSIIKAAEGRREAARAHIQVAERFLARIESRLSEGTATEARTKITTAQNLYTQGEAALDAEDAEKAYTDFMAAFRTAVEVHTYLAAHLNALNVGLEFDIFSRSENSNTHDDKRDGTDADDDSDETGTDDDSDEMDADDDSDEGVNGSTGVNAEGGNASVDGSVNAHVSGSTGASTSGSGGGTNSSTGSSVVGGINVEL